MKINRKRILHIDSTEPLPDFAFNVPTTYVLSEDPRLTEWHGLRERLRREVTEKDFPDQFWPKNIRSWWNSGSDVAFPPGIWVRPRGRPQLRANLLPAMMEAHYREEAEIEHRGESKLEWKLRE